jgi:hypothetical protein
MYKVVEILEAWFVCESSGLNSARKEFQRNAVEVSYRDTSLIRNDPPP